MKSISRRKKIELALLPIFLATLHFFISNLDVTVLFAFGYIWNWVCSLELGEIYSEKQYKFSLLRLVLMIHKSFLKPFKKLPKILQSLIGIIPAGLFWFVIIFIYDSETPIWGPFLGSFVFELSCLEVSFISKEKGQA